MKLKCRLVQAMKSHKRSPMSKSFTTLSSLLVLEASWICFRGKLLFESFALKLICILSEDTLANEMVSNSKNIAVYPNACLKNNCYQNCVKKICELCTTCAGEENLQNIHRAFREHARRGEFKRIFPTERYFDDEFMSKLSPKNQLAAKWFHAKCQQKKDWC